jgi:hypothetical protein
MTSPVTSFSTILAILPGSRYEQDGAQASSLLETTCQEQQGRFHTLLLLDDYLVRQHSGRKHQLIEAEERTLRELYEAVWVELGTAFSEAVVNASRQQVEAAVKASSFLPAQIALFPTT